MIKAVERASRNTQGPYSVQASPLLQAMRSESVPAFPLGGGTVSRTGTAAVSRTQSSALQYQTIERLASASQATAATGMLERVGEMAAAQVRRSLGSAKTSPANTMPSSPRVSRRGSIDSTYSERPDQRHLYGPYRDAFAGVPSVHAEYNRPSSRASSRSGYAMNRFQMAGSGQSSPVLTSRQYRRQRQEMLSELTSSSDDASPNKRRSPKKTTRDLLKSLDLRASDVGSSSSEGSPSPRGAVPRMTRDSRANASRDMHFTTSSTDEDRNRQRAWEEGHQADQKQDSSPGRQSHRRDGNQSQRSRSSGGQRSLNDPVSESEEDGFEAHASVLESALSVVRGLEQRTRSQHESVDMDDVHNVQDYLAKSRGQTPSRGNSISPAKSNRTSVTKAAGDSLQFFTACRSLKQPARVFSAMM
jgi:hypothetical protein